MSHDAYDHVINNFMEYEGMSLKQAEKETKRLLKGVL